MKPSLMPLAVSALLCGGVAQAQDATEHDGHNRLRVHFSKSSETDLVTVVVGDFQRSPENNYLVGATWGHDLSDTLFGLPFPMTWHVGVQYFDERGLPARTRWGATTFVKANYRMRVPWTQKHIDLGLGEGLSYVDRIPMSEQRDFAKKGPDVHSEKLMNYLEWTIDLPLRQFDVARAAVPGRRHRGHVGRLHRLAPLQRLRRVRRREGRRQLHGLRLRSEVLSAAPNGADRSPPRPYAGSSPDLRRHRRFRVRSCSPCSTRRSPRRCVVYARTLKYHVPAARFSTT